MEVLVSGFADVTIAIRNLKLIRVQLDSVFSSIG